MWKPKYFHEIATNSEYSTIPGSAEPLVVSGSSPARSSDCRVSPPGWQHQGR